MKIFLLPFLLLCITGTAAGLTNTNLSPAQNTFGMIFRAGIDTGYSTTPLVDAVSFGFNYSGITGVTVSFSGTGLLNGWEYYRIGNEWYFKSLAVEYLKYLVIEQKYIFMASQNKEFRKQSYSVGAGVRIQPFSFLDDKSSGLMTFRLTGGFSVWDNNVFLDNTDRDNFGRTKWYVEFTMGLETP